MTRRKIIIYLLFFGITALFLCAEEPGQVTSTLVESAMLLMVVGIVVMLAGVVEMASRFYGKQSGA